MVKSSKGNFNKVFAYKIPKREIIFLKWFQLTISEFGIYLEPKTKSKFFIAFKNLGMDLGLCDKSASNWIT